MRRSVTRIDVKPYSAFADTATQDLFERLCNFQNAIERVRSIIHLEHLSDDYTDAIAELGVARHELEQHPRGTHARRCINQQGGLVTARDLERSLRRHLAASDLRRGGRAPSARELDLAADLQEDLD